MPLISQSIPPGAAISDESVRRAVDPHFRRRGVAEEAERTRGTGVGTGLEHPDQIPDPGLRKMDRSSEHVEGCAERPDDVDGRGRLLAQAFNQRDGKVAFDCLAEVSGGGEVESRTSTRKS